MTHTQHRLKGVLFAIIGATLWGLGGTVSDLLFNQRGLDVDWYVTARLLISGVFLLSLYKIRRPKQSIFIVFRNPRTIVSLLIYSLIGMLFVQYAYMASIATGNVAVATLLQYIAPVYIIIWFVIRGLDVFRPFDILAIAMTLIGTFLLLTNGSISHLVVSPTSLFWGIIAGLALAFYTIYATGLLDKFPSILIVGWAMIISGCAMNFKQPIWDVSFNTMSASTIVYLIFGIIAGTALAFYLFIDSLKYLSPKETTLLGTIEPVIAVVTSALWLDVTFQSIQVVGIVLILILILMLSLKKQPEEI
ncbi:DMT family transporter [Staphylococcus sp. GDY8P57P]|uniref:EamA family transporter n=1 Tax=Staphylococcus sp. GDY8P57P TaxID=2804128 RepID=UPI001E55C083|nr:EamA family transporter [Staphylococcus sp. GDY8P57P]